MLHRSLALAVLTAFALTACKDQKQVAEERQKALEAAKAAQKAAEDAKDKPAAGSKSSKVQLDAFWDDSAYVRVSADGQCPDGMWALFPGDAPGDGEEKKANAAKRPELAKKLRDSTFVLHLKTPSNVTLKDYDAPKGVFPLEVVGTIDCVDSIGRIAIAWTAAKANVPGNSAAKQGAEVAQAIWQADSTRYSFPIKSQSEAKEFLNSHRFDINARLVFKLGKADVHKKMFKTTKVTSGEVTLGGGMEDWGAGRMVVAEIQGVRISTDHEKTALIESRGK
ncbi:MAG: hypothetical protein ACYC8T_20065 [Myxococcaceae bacterium]